MLRIKAVVAGVSGRRRLHVRPMGRNTSGVKGISLRADSEVVGMVVADPEATLLTVCEKGYGKRTNFGPNAEVLEGPPLLIFLDILYKTC